MHYIIVEQSESTYKTLRDMQKKKMTDTLKNTQFLKLGVRGWEKTTGGFFYC